MVRVLCRTAVPGSGFDALLLSEGIASKFEVVGAYYDERGDGDDLVAT